MAVKLTALYYPHILIENEGLLKNALLLWDSVDLICPFGEFPQQPEDPQRRAAFAAVARPLQPSEDEMRSAHEAIIELAESDLPDWFFPDRVKPELSYAMYPGKLLAETWEALQKTKLARPVYGQVDPPLSREYLRDLRERKQQEAYETTQAFGLTMLSILADCCGGSTKQLVTDETDSYVALDRYLKLIGGAGSLSWWRRESAHERLATLSVATADLSGVSLSRLVSIRNREEAEPRLRAMRHRYVNKLDTCIERLAKEARSRRDVQEIERTFMQETADDIGLLREELKDEAKLLVFSKEMLGAAAIVAAGVFVEPVVGTLLAAGTLYRAKVSYRAARNRSLDRHAMSWLYEMRWTKLV